MRVPVVAAPVLPDASDPALHTLLAGLRRATGASACSLVLRLEPSGIEGRWASGEHGPGPRLLMNLDTDEFRATCELSGLLGRPSASPTVLEALRPLFESALQALIDRHNAAHQIEVLGEILGVSDAANLVIDSRGEILFANPRGDDVLALHTMHPRARLDGDTQSAPLLDLLVAEMSRMAQRGERNRRRLVTLGDRRWHLEIIALPGLEREGSHLVVLAPVGLPDATDLQRRFADRGVSRREAEVLAHAVAGMTAAEVGRKLGITLYTVKDHLKHAYAKLGVRSRAQLHAMVAASGMAS